MTLPCDYSPDPAVMPDDPVPEEFYWPPEKDAPEHVDTLCERCGEYDECYAVRGRMLCSRCCERLGGS